jgi:serine protease Do
VVGVNTAVIPRQRIGFAIPINMAKSILPQLREKGKVGWGFLGIGIQELSPGLTEALGVSKKEGALVTNVIPGQAAEKAGVQRGDVILEFNGTSIKDVRHLQRLVAQTGVGRGVTLKVLRQGETQTLAATVGEFAQELVMSREGPPAPLPKEVFGLTLEELTPETARKFKLSEQRGVVVAEVAQGSPAAEAGIRPGDLLTEVDQKPVKTIQDVRQALKEWKRTAHLFLIKRGESYVYVAIKGKG